MAGLAHVKLEYVELNGILCPLLAYAAAYLGIFRLNPVSASWHPCRAIPHLRTLAVFRLGDITLDMYALLNYRYFVSQSFYSL